MASTVGALFALKEKDDAIAIIVRVLNKHEGDITASARALGCGRNTLIRYVRRYVELQTTIRVIRTAAGWSEVNGRWYPPGAE